MLASLEKINMLDEFLQAEIPITKKFKPKAIDLLCFATITAICILARVALFTNVSNDYKMFLSDWFEILKSNGGFSGIGISIGDYTPPYFYILAFLTYLPIDPLISIKLVSCIFDFALALVVLNMLFEKTGKYTIAIFGYGAILLAPTVILNSAAWAQCDVIFVFFLVLSMRAIMKGKPFLSLIYFGISFVFKLQAIFFVPLLLVLFLKGKIKFRHFLLVPAVYVVAIIPSWLMGRNILELLTIYISQSGQYSRLSMNAPNPYLLLGQSSEPTVSAMGIMICAAIIIVMIYLAYSKQFTLNSEIIVTLSLISAIVVPYFLPHMHERYFYFADVLAIIYAFYRPKRWYVAGLVGISSLLCYLPFLYGTTPVPLMYAVLMMTAALIIAILDLLSQIKTLPKAVPQKQVSKEGN